MSVIKQCAVCGGEFNARDNRLKTCSSTCKAKKTKENDRSWKSSNRERANAVNRKSYHRIVAKYGTASRGDPDKRRETLKRYRLTHSEEIRAYRDKQQAALRLVRELEKNGIGALL